MFAQGFTKQAFNQKVCKKKTLMNNDANPSSNLDFHIISNHKVSNWWLNLMMASVKNSCSSKAGRRKIMPLSKSLRFLFLKSKHITCMNDGQKSRNVDTLQLLEYLHFFCFMTISSWDYCYLVNFWENLKKLSFYCKGRNRPRHKQ